MIIDHALTMFTDLQAVFRTGPSSSLDQGWFSVNTVLGDGSGTFHIQSGQRFYIEYEEATSRRSFPKVNFDVDVGGELVAVADFHVSGSKDPALKLNGRITGK